LTLEQFKRLVRMIARHSAAAIAGLLLERIDHMATQVEQLQTSIDTMTGKVNGALARQAAKIKKLETENADLKAQVAAQDLTPQIAAIDGVGATADTVEPEPAPAA
jgi:DNA anti-recombination protein RmuC